MNFRGHCNNDELQHCGCMCGEASAKIAMYKPSMRTSVRDTPHTIALVTIEIKEVYDAWTGFHIFVHIILQVDKRYVTQWKIYSFCKAVLTWTDTCRPRSRAIVMLKKSCWLTGPALLSSWFSNSHLCLPLFASGQLRSQLIRRVLLHQEMEGHSYKHWLANVSSGSNGMELHFFGHPLAS